MAQIRKIGDIYGRGFILKIRNFARLVTIARQPFKSISQRKVSQFDNSLKILKKNYINAIQTQDFQPTRNFYHVQQTVFIDFVRMWIIGQEMARRRSSPRTTKIPVWTIIVNI